MDGYLVLTGKNVADIENYTLLCFDFQTLLRVD
jgi:hypothetical protein